MYDSRSIANWFIKRRKLTPMQILKLVYIAHGHYLAKTGNALIKDPVEAWQHGPIIPSLYHAVKRHGRSVVTEPLKQWSLGFFFEPEGEEIPEPTDPKVVSVLEQVRDGYAHFTGSHLSSLAHLKYSPWYQVAGQYKDKLPLKLEIPDHVIREYYSHLTENIDRALNERRQD